MTESAARRRARRLGDRNQVCSVAATLAVAAATAALDIDVDAVEKQDMHIVGSPRAGGTRSR